MCPSDPSATSRTESIRTSGDSIFPDSIADVTVVNSIHSHDPRVPLGPLYLCSFLEAHGYDVDFRDYQICDDVDVGKPEHFAAWLSGAAPIVAISTLSSSLPLVLASLSRTQLRDQIETVVLGGPGVSSLGTHILRLFPSVDIVVRGEGELTLLELVKQLRNGGSLDQVSGITYRDGRDIKQNSPRERLHDLDVLPFPAYHHVDLQEYTKRTEFDRIPLAVLSARGCPYMCTFCDIPGIWSGGIRYRSVANVLQELDLLRTDHGIPRFHVADDTFVMDRERVFEFCSALEDRDFDMPWSCLGRVDRMDEEVLQRLAAAKCDTIFYGIESGSDEILQRIGKGFTAGEAMDVVQLSKNYMKVHVSFIWGFPFEILDDLYDTTITLLAMFRMGAEPHLNVLVPLPSAEINKTYRKHRSSQKAWEIGWDWAMMENYEYSNELHDLIGRHPDIFAPFYRLDSPDFDRKLSLLESWGLGLGNARPPHHKGGERAHDASLELEGDTRLPAISDDVLLRNIGKRWYIFDLTDCLLFEPGPRYAELFRACQRRDRLEQTVATLSLSAGCSAKEAQRFVVKVLRKFAERGFLTRSPAL
ncbi:B12-binding domain-containing radical SAM protein [Gemmatimonadota bacterium]